MIGYAILFTLAAALSLIRLVRGPTAPDRMVALDTAGTIMIGVIALLSIELGKSYLLDIAILYALLLFVATTVLSKYLRGVL